MDFGLSEDQELLQQSARDFLQRECPTSLVRASATDSDGHPRDLYGKMAELGWMGLVVPETHGGMGLSMIELALLLEEMGRVALPGPFFSSAVLATIALKEGGTMAQKKQWLPKLAAGEVVGTLAFVEESDRLDAGGITARASRTRAGYRLRGTKMFVTDAHVADFLIVALRTGGKAEEGVTLFLVPRESPGVTLRLLESVDLTRRSAEVELRDVEVPASSVLGGEGRGWKTLARIVDAACVALASDGLGGSDRALRMAVEYAKVREQFGRPVGSFQAVKHLAAEMVSEVEPSRALVWYAAYAFDSVPKDASRAAAMAKARMSEVYSRTTNRAVQIHGGIGFTWEHDMHLWFKRAKWNELAFGDATYHRERVALLSRL